MVFTKEDGILIKVLRQSKGYIARKLLEEFPDKDWSCSAMVATDMNTFVATSPNTILYTYIRSSRRRHISPICPITSHYNPQMIRPTVS